jgi:hypothetical protein
MHRQDIMPRQRGPPIAATLRGAVAGLARNSGRCAPATPAAMASHTPGPSLPRLLARTARWTSRGPRPWTEVGVGEGADPVAGAADLSQDCRIWSPTVGDEEEEECRCCRCRCHAGGGALDQLPLEPHPPPGSKVLLEGNRSWRGRLRRTGRRSRVVARRPSRPSARGRRPEQRRHQDRRVSSPHRGARGVSREFLTAAILEGRAGLPAVLSGSGEGREDEVDVRRRRLGFTAAESPVRGDGSVPSRNYVWPNAGKLSLAPVI